MKKIVSFLMCALLVFGTTPLKAGTKYKVPKSDRTFYVTGPIDRGALAIANGIERASVAGKETIHLVINSPGGVVLVGFQITQAMDIARERGVKVVCVVGVLAASMAFQLLPHCDERYALKKSLLLFHPARVLVNGPLTATDALTVGHELQKLDRKADKENSQMMGVSKPEWLEKHNRNETLWTAEDLVAETAKSWLKIVDEIETPDGIFNLETKMGPSEGNKRINGFENAPWVIVNEMK